MNLIEIQRGLRQVVMALMFWAIDVPQELLQSDAKPDYVFCFLTKLMFFFLR